MFLRRVSLIAAVLLAVVGNYAFWSLTNQPVDAGTDVPGGRLRSVSYAPFRDGEIPGITMPAPQRIDEDLALLQGKVQAIRTYTSREGLQVLPELARRRGIKVTMGAWLNGKDASNRAEIDSLVYLANAYPDVIERVIVGNEVLLRRELTPEQIVGYIREVKSRIAQPVSYADVWAFLLKHPEVAREVDFLTVHILPFWEDEPAAVEQAGPHIVHYVNKMKEAFPGKPVLIGEAGWPTMGRQRGPAVPGVVNAARFVRTLVEVADRNGFDYNVVEAFDQHWKANLEGTVGGKWGLWSSDRRLVVPLVGPVVEHPDWWWRFALSSLVMLGLIGPFALRLRGLGIFGAVALAQVMAAVLTQYGFAVQVAGISFWKNSTFGLAPHMVAMLFAAALTVFAMGIIERAAGSFDERPSNGLAVYLPGLYRVFSVVAAVLATAIAIDGRYFDIPNLQFLLPAAGVIGLGLLRLTTDRDMLSAFSAWECFGGRPRRLSLMLAAGLPLLAVANVIGEGFAIAGEDFAVAHPTVAEQAPLILAAMSSNASVFVWSAILLALAVPHLADVALARRAGLPVWQAA